MSNLQQLISFRKAHADLTESEHVQFMSGIATKCDTSRIMAAFFTGFCRSNDPLYDANQIKTINNIIKEIKENRVPTNEDSDDDEGDDDLPLSNQEEKDINLQRPPKRKLCDLPKESIGEIASFLNLEEYHRLCIVSRQLYLH